jgi:hypothetical protein
MKKLTALLTIIILIASACEKNSSTDSFSNSLKLGTSINSSNFTLNGEGTLFMQGTTICFRLESKDDMAGSPVRISINQVGSSIFDDHDYASTQDYGHIFMSSFDAPAPGNYTATGILTAGNKTIASINFTVQ